MPPPGRTRYDDEESACIGIGQIPLRGSSRGSRVGHSKNVLIFYIRKHKVKELFFELFFRPDEPSRVRPIDLPWDQDWKIVHGLRNQDWKIVHAQIQGGLKDCPRDWKIVHTEGLKDCSHTDTRGTERLSAGLKDCPYRGTERLSTHRSK